MLLVDARGLSCPEPLMMVSAAIKDHPGEKIQVLLSEPYSKANVEKYVKNQGKKVTVKETGSEFELIVE